MVAFVPSTLRVALRGGVFRSVYYQVISQDSVIAKGYDNLQKAVDHAGVMGEENSYRVANPAGLGGGTVSGAGIPAYELDHYLSKHLTKKIEVNWGDLSR